MAAGLGFKTFTTGEVLTAADTNGYLMQGVNVFASAAARTAAIASPQEGQMSFLKDTNSTEYYSGSAWVAVASAAPAGANWSLLNAGGTALTGATTITVSGISGQDKIMVLIQNASSVSSSNPNIGVRLNTDTGSNYTYRGIENYIASTYNNNNFYSTSFTGTYIPIAQNGTNDTSEMSGYALITGCNAAGVKVYNCAGSGGLYGSTAKQFIGAGVYNSATVISSVSLFSTVGNFDNGTLYIYASA
jgi:hypothetical protein